MLLITLHELKLYNIMQGNEKFVKYQGMNGIAILRQSQSKLLIIWFHRQPDARVLMIRFYTTFTDYISW